MNQLQTQVSTLTDRLNEMTAKQSAASSQTSSDLRRAALRGRCREYHGSPGQLRRRPPPKPAPAKRATAKRHTPADKRYTQLQTQLTEQQKKLSDMQEQVEKNRSDLEETSIQRAMS